jgi:hypothetical protein
MGDPNIGSEARGRWRPRAGASEVAVQYECRSGFVTLSPESLQEQPAVVLLCMGFSLFVVSSRRMWWTW